MRLECEAVTFNSGVWQAVVRGVIQRPIFNTEAEAFAFAVAVFNGERPAEPADTTSSKP